MLKATISFDGREGLVLFNTDSINYPTMIKVRGWVSLEELSEEVIAAHLNPVQGFVRSVEGATVYELVNTLRQVGCVLELDDEAQRLFEEEQDREMEEGDSLVEF
ncbi:TPA: hypothetical protein ACSTLU_004339 [Serratia fonticola]